MHRQDTPFRTAVAVQTRQLGAEHLCGAQCVQISDPWLLHEVLAVAGRRPDLIDKPRGFPLPVYDCFDRVSPDVVVGSDFSPYEHCCTLIWH